MVVAQTLCYGRRTDVVLWSSHRRCVHTHLTLLCHICCRVCSLNETHDWFPSYFWNRDGCHMWYRKSHSFHITWFHSVWGVRHDFTQSLYTHYRMCRSLDYVYGIIVYTLPTVSIFRLCVWNHCLHIPECVDLWTMCTDSLRICLPWLIWRLYLEHCICSIRYN